MNGVRSTYMRKGYLLTALAAAVLLAASSGTALAQQSPSVGFVGSSGTVAENATAASTTPDLLKVTVGISGVPASGDERTMALTALGAITIREDPDTLEIMPTTLDFTRDDEVVLTITPPAGDNNWKDEKYTLKLVSDKNVETGGVFTITVDDDEVQPTASFTRTNVKLTEDSSTMVGVKVGVGRGQTAPVDALAALTGEANMIQIVVTPADAFDADDGVATIEGDATPVPMMPGVYTVGTIADAADATPNMLTIMANADMSGFQHPEITLAFVAKALMGRDAGDISAGAAAVIQIESDEPTPTVSFSPTDVTVDEGGSVETVLIAEGAHGSEVMEVTLSVKAGDALVGLYQGMDKLEANAAGNIVVDLGTSNSARLTAKSYSDPDLMDGDTNFIAWEITDAGGANIGAGYWFRVDVMGSTAVPALPLLGQLLLALFLMAGGARLYRRRQG